jgi:elongator complex protein 4
MSFRKRSTPLNPANTTSSTSVHPLPSSATPTPPGIRPSPLDGRPTTSTGTPTLDALFGGHAGLPLGTSLLIEESGTTDFAGAVLRFYAAEGVVQGQRVHVVGVEEGWGRELPGLVAQEVGRGEQGEGEGRGEKMKIAWRYEGLGEFGEGRARGGFKAFLCIYYKSIRSSS